MLLSVLSVCAERVCFSVCFAALSSHVSRGACVIAESVQSVQKKEEEVGVGHDEGQVRCNGRRKRGRGGEREGTRERIV